MKITVKREHIDNGIALSSTCCPIALAGKELGLKDIWVTPRWMIYSLNDRMRSFTLPQTVQEFVRRFDEGEHVTTISFDLPVLDSYGRV